MRAAVYRGPDQMVVETVPVPVIGAGELLVQVSACGVCGTDLKKIHRGLQPPPRIYGHETVGRIAALGDGVSDWRLGQRVALYHHIPCGTCKLCRRGVPAQCPVYKRTGITAGFEPAGGGFAEYVRVMDWIVAGGGVVAVPDGVTDEVASFVEPTNTGLKAMARSGLAPGDSAVVIGAGPIGLLLLQLATAHGATVVVSDPLPGRRELAIRLGAAAAAAPEEVVAACADQTAGLGADACFLAVPDSRLIAPALAMVRPGGVVVTFAQTRMEDPFTADAGQLGTLDKIVLGAYSSDVALNQAASAMVFERRIDVASLVTHTFGLDDIALAIATAATPTDNSLKVVVRP